MFTDTKQSSSGAGWVPVPTNLPQKSCRIKYDKAPPYTAAVQRAPRSWPLDELNYNQQEKNIRPFVQHNGASLICLPAVPSKGLLPTEGFGVQKWIQATTYYRVWQIKLWGVHITKGSRVLEDKSLLQSAVASGVIVQPDVMNSFSATYKNI